MNFEVNERSYMIFRNEKEDLLNILKGNDKK